jgi:hypothetical protein
MDQAPVGMVKGKAIRSRFLSPREEAPLPNRPIRSSPRRSIPTFGRMRGRRPRRRGLELRSEVNHWSRRVRSIKRLFVGTSRRRCRPAFNSSMVILWKAVRSQLLPGEGLPQPNPLPEQTSLREKSTCAIFNRRPAVALVPVLGTSSSPVVKYRSVVERRAIQAFWSFLPHVRRFLVGRFPLAVVLYYIIIDGDLPGTCSRR